MSTLAGSDQGFKDESRLNARFSWPFGMAIWSGVLYVTEFGNCAIRYVTPVGMTGTAAGTGLGGAQDGLGGPSGVATFQNPAGLAFDGQGNLYVADRDNHKIRKISWDKYDRVVSTFAGTGVRGYRNGDRLDAEFDSPTGIAVNGLGEVLVADSNNHVIRRIATDGRVYAFAGSTIGFADGQGSAARFRSPGQLAWGTLDGALYVADAENHRIRKITAEGQVSTVAGNGVPALVDGPAEDASFNLPLGVAVDSAGAVFVGDQRNHRIRRIYQGRVSTFAGSGSGGPAVDGNALSALFSYPTQLAVWNGTLFVADQGNHRIRAIE